MDEEIAAAPSEENGNVPLDAPSEQPQEQVPAVEEPAKPAETTEEQLFETPDGRKVDAATLQKEWKENFLPEFTRKSQELARLTKPETINQTVEKPYEKPDWQPQTYGELLKVAEEKVLGTLQQQEQARIEQQKALEDSVNSQLTEIKKVDASLNENALFQHANKYGFKDLRLAYQNMKDMVEMAKKVQTTTAQNIAKRNDPVSASPGATGQRPDPSQFGSAIEYLRSLK